MAHSDGTGAGRHALIIEDEPLIALEIEAILQRLGFSSADVAATVADAEACARRRRPDLITADICIVGGDGQEAVRRIRAALGPIPAVFVTAGAGPVSAGEGEIVRKPIDAGALEAACRFACMPAARRT